MAVVVVLPLVAETTAAPPGNRAASASIALGSSFQSSLPGSVVPPPAPARRESFPAARAARDSTARRALIRGREYPRPGSSRRIVPRSSELRPAYPERVRNRHPIAHTVFPVSTRPGAVASWPHCPDFMRPAPSADKGERWEEKQAAIAVTFVRVPFGVLETAAASSDRMPSGARVVGAASSRSSASSCCHWQREPHRPKCAARRLHPRSLQPSWSQACSSGRRRIRAQVPCHRPERNRARRRRSLRSTTREGRRPAASRSTRSWLRTTEKSAKKAYSKFKTRRISARASAERDRWHAEREEAKALRKSARGELDDRFDFINGVSMEMSGRRLERLARIGGLIITEDVAVQQQDLQPASDGLNQLRRPRSSSGRTSPGSASSGRDPRDMPTIAIVDSGIDTTLPDFAGRNIKQLNFVGSGKTNGYARRSRSRQLRCRYRSGLGDVTTPAWHRTLRSSRSTSWTTPARAGRVT